MVLTKNNELKAFNAAFYPGAVFEKKFFFLPFFFAVLNLIAF
jgi:hypothetical protein